MNIICVAKANKGKRSQAIVSEIQKKIDIAGGYANEIGSYSVAGQTFINTGKAYLEEAQELSPYHRGHNSL